MPARHKCKQFSVLYPNFNFFYLFITLLYSSKCSCLDWWINYLFVFVTFIWLGGDISAIVSSCIVFCCRENALIYVQTYHIFIRRRMGRGGAQLWSEFDPKIKCQSSVITVRTHLLVGPITFIIGWVFKILLKCLWNISCVSFPASLCKYEIYNWRIVFIVTHVSW